MSSAKPTSRIWLKRTLFSTYTLNIELLLLFFEVSLRPPVLAGVQGCHKQRLKPANMTTTTNVTAKYPRISTNNVNLPRAENKHLTSSQLSTFINQTSHEPSQTEGHSKMTTRYFVLNGILGRFTLWKGLAQCNIEMCSYCSSIHHPKIQKVPDGWWDKG